MFVEVPFELFGCVN